MSYKYKVYSNRVENLPLNDILKEPAIDIVSGVFGVLGVAGFISNLIVLSVFYKFYRPWRMATRLWVNMTMVMLLTSITLIFRSLGDVVESMSNTILLCKFRVYVPTAIDVACFGSLAIMLFERLSVVHFLNLYTYNETNNTVKILYGWLMGLLFFLYKVFVNTTDPVPHRCVTPFSRAFPLETVSLWAVFIALVMLLVTIMGYLFTPNVNSYLHHSWIELETSETVRVIILAASIITLWFPKQLLAFHYLSNGMDNYKYQIWMVIVYIPARVTPLLPFFILFRVKDFRAAIKLRLVNDEAPDVVQLRNQILTEETKAEVLQRSIALAQYPSHPLLKNTSVPAQPTAGKEQSLVRRPSILKKPGGLGVAPATTDTESDHKSEDGSTHVEAVKGVKSSAV